MSYPFNTGFNPAPTIGYNFGTSGASTSTTTFTPTASTGSSFGNYFKSDAGQATISQGIGALLNFGVTAFGSNQARQDLKAQANIVAQQGQNQLAVAKEGTKQAELQLQALQAQSGVGGNTALYIGLGVVGVVVLGVVIYAVAKR